MANGRNTNRDKLKRLMPKLKPNPGKIVLDLKNTVLSFYT